MGYLLYSYFSHSYIEKAPNLVIHLICHVILSVPSFNCFILHNVLYFLSALVLHHGITSRSMCVVTVVYCYYSIVFISIVSILLHYIVLYCVVLYTALYSILLYIYLLQTNLQLYQSVN